jgi:hypothetical protein
MFLKDSPNVSGSGIIEPCSISSVLANLLRTPDLSLYFYEPSQNIDMIFLTQLIYIKEGQETIFHQFEDIAIPTITKYNGRLLLRLRPDNNSMIENNIDKPYEVHLVEFEANRILKISNRTRIAKNSFI